VLPVELTWLFCRASCSSSALDAARVGRPFEITVAPVADLNAWFRVAGLGISGD